MEIEIWVQPIFRVTDSSANVEFIEVLARGTNVGDQGSAGYVMKHVTKNKLHSQLDTFIFNELHKIKVPDNIRICVNVFSETLAIKGIASMLSDSVIKNGVRPHNIVVELNEDTDIYNDNVIDNIRTFKRRGFKIALDDFGKSNANIDFLLKCPLDIIKVDKEIINCSSELSHEAHKNICKAVVDMIKAMGADKIIEGVETCEQLSMVREAGFNKIQGFLLSKPMKLSSFMCGEAT